MNTYEVILHEYGSKTVQAASRSGAKYAAYLDCDITGGLGFGEYLKWVKSVHLLHKFRPSDLFGDPEAFERMKAHRCIPFAYMGQKVVLHSQNRGELTGVICGSNSGMNLNVLFEGTTHTENCHPHHRMSYFSEAGEEIAYYH